MIHTQKSATAARVSPSSLAKAAPVDSLTNALRTLLADVVTLDARVESAQWNVTGEDFPTYNEFFREITWTTEDLIEPVARALRVLGASAPLLLSDVVALRSIQDPSALMTDSVSLVADILGAMNATIGSFQAAIAAAVGLNMREIADDLSRQIDRLQNWIWKLNAAGSVA